MSLPLLLEARLPSGVFVLCSFHGAQYVASATSLPGGVILTVTDWGNGRTIIHLVDRQ
jgi:hypothetical protein